MHDMPTINESTNLSPRRKEVSPEQWGVAAPSTSQQFKIRDHSQKPLALKWDHRLSLESVSRTGSSLKGAFMYLQNPNIISLGGGLPLADYFPFENIDYAIPLSANWLESGKPAKSLGKNAKLSAGKHDRTGGKSIYDLTVALNYCQGSGSAQLLRWITEHTEIVHDPPYADWQCTMTIGNTSALDMVFRMFIQRGDYVLADEFTFSSAAETALPMGAKFVGVEMDSQGMLPESLCDILKNWDPTTRGGARRPFLLYSIPTGQNPTGATQSLQRRKELYNIAREFDLIIIEDDPYYFLQLDPYVSSGRDNKEVLGGPSPGDLLNRIIPSYLRIDVDGRVVRMDSFSKVISPGSRIGWITASQQIVDRFKSHADVSTQGPSGFSQLALFKLLDEHWGHAGYFEWLLHIRQEYTKRRDFIIEACDRHLPKGLVTWAPTQAGMFQWLRVDWASYPQAGTKTGAEVEEEIWLESIKQGALVARGSWFYVSEKPLKDIYFRITFAAAPLDQVETAVSRFGDALRHSFGLE